MTSKAPQSGTTPPPKAHSRQRCRLLVGIGAAMLVMLTTAACTGSTSTDPKQSATTPRTATAAPTTATPEQAASAAAVNTYKQYIDVVDQVLRRGGTNPESLKTVAISDELTIQQRSAAQFSQNKWHAVGTTIIDSIKVKSVSLTSDPDTFKVPEVILNTCIDATNSYAVDKTGKNVRPADAPTFYTWKVWVRNYPKKGGVNGWFVARTQGSGVSKC